MEPVNLDAHPESRPPATGEIGRLRDQVITQAFVAGQMDAQYTAAAWQNRDALRVLKAKAYALALDSIDALIAMIRTEARLQAEEAKAQFDRHVEWADKELAAREKIIDIYERQLSKHHDQS